MNANELTHLIALSYPNAVQTRKSHELIKNYGTAEAIFRESSSRLALLSRGRFFQDKKFRNQLLYQAEKEHDFIAKNNISVHHFKGDTYPRRLKECKDCPLLLFTKGNTNFNQGHFISIVGTRKMTPYGKACIQNFVEDIACYKDDTTIVSGLAYGVDAEAHKAALNYNIPTMGVVAHGLDTLYPAKNRPIAKKMVESNGTIITEFPSKIKIEPSYFLQRNRIVAGMCDVLIVIESAIRGGAISTATIANSYNRDVCAFPGRTIDTYSAGCNYLIKEHNAHLIQSAEELYTTKEWLRDNNRTVQQKLFEPLSIEEKEILKQITTNPTNLNTISLLTRIPIQQLIPILVKMELNNLVIQLPGNCYLAKK